MGPIATLALVPQQSELRPLIAGLSNRGMEAESANLGSLRVHYYEPLKLAVALGGHGKAQMAVQTQYLIDRCPGVENVLCIGAAGALSTELRFGDLVIGTSCIEHDYTLRFIDPSLPVHKPDEALVRSLQRDECIRALPFTVHFGAIASGDEDIVDAERAAELREATDALCVAWEGSGAARAASFNGLGFLEIRAITDAADATAKRSFDENLEIAMPNVSELLVRWADVLMRGP